LRNSDLRHAPVSQDGCGRVLRNGNVGASDLGCARSGFDTAVAGLLNRRWSSEAETRPSEAEARLGFDTAVAGLLNQRAGLERPDHVVDRRDERAHIVGLDRGEGCDAQLVASEFAVRVGVDDSVGAQDLGDSRRIHVV